jgi:hypothetical protein
MNDQNEYPFVRPRELQWRAFAAISETVQLYRFQLTGQILAEEARMGFEVRLVIC